MKLFQGAYTALVTPFLNGKIDFNSLEKLIDMQVAAGIHGFIVNGTTAESPTLSKAEAFELLAFVKNKVGGKRKIIFGSGTNNTAHTIELSQEAEKKGADGLLVVVPYYNKPPQQGLYLHFKAVAESVSLPVMLYNVPGRTITSLNLATISQLQEIKNIVAIKEATGDLDFGRQILLSAKKDFLVSSGDDETSLALKKAGGQGIVSVCTHIMPTKMAKWFSTETTDQEMRDFSGAIDLIRSLYITSNPIPVKAALHMMGIIASDEMRLPLCGLDADQKKTLETQLKKYEAYLR
ncbi:MAG: 4-hydroxy-tetrahydrodipicolinate synthase [Bdellovibrionaceae bacterium]|nr:4-hydroxy-tetrahydrodipicolinate synthase [Pseudobdellovibrionaceae bacterium]